MKIRFFCVQRPSSPAAQNFQRRVPRDAAAEGEAAEDGEAGGGGEGGGEQSADRATGAALKTKMASAELAAMARSRPASAESAPSVAYSMMRMVRTCLRRGAERAQEDALAQALVAAIEQRADEDGQSGEHGESGEHGDDAGDFLENAADGFEDQREVDGGDIGKLLDERRAAVRRRKRPAARAW